ncbi:MAG: hypothetical protein OER92_08220 [Alphaproteobacteria bacterium]|nr:hypothetical protein [Alphaproteobacteria bacterium]
MRAWLIIVMTFTAGTFAVPAHADVATETFKARIEAALAIGDDAKRSAAVGALFHQQDLGAWSQSLVERVIGIIAKKAGHEISFIALAPDADLIHVVDGYEYRPNLEPLGQVVFTDPAAEPGNNTKVLYGRPAGEDRLFFPLTVRRLVNPEAPPDKQLQMITIGISFPPSTFEGWCDIALSNNTVKRVKIDDQKMGNQTLILRGQSIEACEITNTSSGPLSLRLYEDDREIFLEQIDTPQTTISYRKP